MHTNKGKASAKRDETADRIIARVVRYCDALRAMAHVAGALIIFGILALTTLEHVAIYFAAGAIGTHVITKSFDRVVSVLFTRMLKRAITAAGIAVRQTADGAIMINEDRTA